MEKPRIVLCNKIDVEGAYDRAVEIAHKIHETEKDIPVVPVSVLTGNGMKDARQQIISLVNLLEKRQNNEENNTDKESSFGSDFMATRAVLDDYDDENVQYPGSEN